MFDANDTFKVCFFNFEVLKLVDEDPVKADDEEESSFAEWFSSLEFVADLAFAAMSGLFDTIVDLEICVLNFEVLKLVDEDPAKADDEEESSFAKWFSSDELVADLAFTAMWDLFDVIVGLEICVFNFEVLRLVDEDPVEADDEEESSFAKWFSSFEFVADLAFAIM